MQIWYDPLVSKTYPLLLLRLASHCCCGSLCAVCEAATTTSNLSESSIHHKQLADSTRQQDLEVLKTGKVITREELTFLENDDERLHTLLTIKFPIFDRDDRISGLGAVATDITEQRESQQLLGQAARIAHLGHWSYDELAEKALL